MLANGRGFEPTPRACLWGFSSQHVSQTSLSLRFSLIARPNPLQGQTVSGVLRARRVQDRHRLEHHDRGALRPCDEARCVVLPSGHPGSFSKPVAYLSVWEGCFLKRRFQVGAPWGRCAAPEEQPLSMRRAFFQSWACSLSLLPRRLQAGHIAWLRVVVGGDFGQVLNGPGVGFTGWGWASAGLHLALRSVLLSTSVWAVRTRGWGGPRSPPLLGPWFFSGLQPTPDGEPPIPGRPGSPLAIALGPPQSPMGPV